MKKKHEVNCSNVNSVNNNTKLKLGQAGTRLVRIFHLRGILIVTDYVCLNIGYNTNTVRSRQWAERILKRRHASPPGFLIDAKAARSGMLSQ